MLRLDRTSDRLCLVKLFQIAAKSNSAGADIEEIEKDKQKNPAFESITFLRFEAMASPAPSVTAHEAAAKVKSKANLAPGLSSPGQLATVEDGSKGGAEGRPLLQELHECLLLLDTDRVAVLCLNGTTPFPTSVSVPSSTPPFFKHSEESAEERRIGQKLIGSIAMRFRLHGNIPRLLRWAETGDEEDGKAITLVAPSRVLHATRLKVEEFMSLKALEQHKTDPLGPSCAVRAASALASVLLWLSCIPLPPPPLPPSAVTPSSSAIHDDIHEDEASRSLDVMPGVKPPLDACGGDMQGGDLVITGTTKFILVFKCCSECSGLCSVLWCTISSCARCTSGISQIISEIT